jgi:hypothetical protein
MQSRSWLVLVVLFLLCPWLLAQKVPAGAAATDVAAGPDSATLNKLIRDQFGKGYKLLPGYEPLVADFDGDGVADLAVAATTDNPLLNAVEFHYTVIDPYHSFFGYGNAKTMMEFRADDPRFAGQVVLLIHGAADGQWHAAQPKAKFVVVNLPYIRLSLSHVLRHKKPLAALAAEEPDKVTSVVYWDGKKYKYEPMGADAD